MQCYSFIYCARVTRDWKAAQENGSRDNDQCMLNVKPQLSEKHSEKVIYLHCIFKGHTNKYHCTNILPLSYFMILLGWHI